MAVVEERMEIDLTGEAFTDELQSNVGASAFTLDHDWFWGGATLEIWTGLGKTGTKLTEGAGDDYVLSVEDTYLTSESGKTVYGKVQVVNAAYQACALYFNGEYIADSVKAAHINTLQDQIDDLGGAQDRITKGSQTIDAGVDVGDAIFPNVTREVVDLCSAADWTDDAEITSTVNSSTSIMPPAALNLTKDTGANTVASISKTQSNQLDFTSKKQNLYLYIDDAATLAKLTTLDCVTIRYGSDASNYYAWEKNKADMAVGWNFIDNLTSATADSTTGTPVIASMDYVYLALKTNNAGDTWTAGKVIMDYWFLASDEEWKTSGQSLPSPQAIYIGSNTVLFKGYTDQLSDLIPSLYYWMGTDGKPTPDRSAAFNDIRLFFALSNTEAVVDIEIEGDAKAINNLATMGYSIGGKDNAGAVVDAVDQYTPDVWTAMSVLPAPSRSMNYCGGVAGKGYSCYGNGGSALLDVDEYVLDSWASMANGTAPARYGSAANRMDNKLYCATGYASGYILDCDEYTPPSTWVNETNKIGSGVYYVSGFELADKGYWLGGYSGAYQTYTHEYVAGTDTWNNRTAFPGSGKYITAAADMLSKGYLTGGDEGSHVSDHDEYDESGDSWTTRTVLSVGACAFMGAFQVGNKYYAFGGYTGGARKNHCLEYIVDAWATVQVMLANRYEMGAFEI